jgi:hypothetical protein
MNKIPPSQQIQEAIRALLTEGLPAGANDVTRELVRLGAQRLVQELLEQAGTGRLGASTMPATVNMAPVAIAMGIGRGC